VACYEARKGGLPAAVLFGSERAIRELDQGRLNRHFVLVGLVLSMAVYHVALSLSRKQDPTPIVFAAFAFVFLLRMLITGEFYASAIVPEVPWHVLIRLEYLSFYWAYALFLMFVHLVFPDDFDTWVLRGVQAGVLVFSLGPIALPVSLFTLTLVPFQIFFLLGGVYCAGVMIWAVLRRRFGARLFMAGFVFVLITSVNDVLYFNDVLHTAQLASYGIVVFLFCQAVVLVRTFSRSFQQAEALSASLENANAALRQSQAQIREQHAEMIRLAHQDHLTDLPNRLVLSDMLSREIARARRNGTLVAVIFLDLDEFKNVNDSMGHPAGDELLRNVARRLSRIIRTGDTLFRLGGDEFTVAILDTSDRGQIAAAAAKIVRAMTQPFEVAGREVVVKASLGIAVFPQDGSDAQTLIRHADIAMYRVKKTTKGDFIFFDHAMVRESEQRIALTGKMPRALASQEFLLHYQPQIDANTGRIYGLEALIRWFDPEEGLISPARFIPVAEETGFIVLLGQWILEEACRRLAGWQKQSFDVHVAVNISSIQFARADFVKQVSESLRMSGARSDRLVLELTERVVMTQEPWVVDRLSRLRSLGIKIAVDDFGTGYSSLNYLRRFPLNHLKIDRSFIRDMFTNEYDSEIVRTIIDLAHVLGLQVVAEGVETEEQRRFLTESRCALMQGFLFGRPAPAEEFAKLLSDDE
jgi:diguanylate cyclase (GGDEF)-like protein